MTDTASEVKILNILKVLYDAQRIGQLATVSQVHIQMSYSS